VNKSKYIYANFSPHNKILWAILKQKYLVTKFYIEQDQDPVFFKGRIRIRIKMVWIHNTVLQDTYQDFLTPQIRKIVRIEECASCLTELVNPGLALLAVHIKARMQFQAC
jgi:hypothetical protein